MQQEEEEKKASQPEDNQNDFEYQDLKFSKDSINLDNLRKKRIMMGGKGKIINTVAETTTAHVDGEMPEFKSYKPIGAILPIEPILNENEDATEMKYRIGA